MYFIIILITILFVLSAIQIGKRIFQYTWGVGSEYIYLKHGFWHFILFIIVMLIPVINVMSLIYNFLYSKNVDELMRIRKTAMENYTPYFIVSRLESFIQNNDLYDTSWVNEVWERHNTDYWLNLLNLNQELLKRPIDECVLVDPYGEIITFWIPLMKDFIYLQEMKSSNLQN